MSSMENRLRTLVEVGREIAARDRGRSGNQTNGGTAPRSRVQVDQITPVVEPPGGPVLRGSPFGGVGGTEKFPRAVDAVPVPPPDAPGSASVVSKGEDKAVDGVSQPPVPTGAYSARGAMVELETGFPLGAVDGLPLAREEAGAPLSPAAGGDGEESVPVRAVSSSVAIPNASGMPENVDGISEMSDPSAACPPDVKSAAASVAAVEPRTVRVGGRVPDFTSVATKMAVEAEEKFMKQIEDLELSLVDRLDERHNKFERDFVSAASFEGVAAALDGICSSWDRFQAEIRENYVSKEHGYENFVSRAEVEKMLESFKGLYARAKEELDATKDELSQCKQALAAAVDSAHENTQKIQLLESQLAQCGVVAVGSSASFDPETGEVDPDDYSTDSVDLSQTLKHLAVEDDMKQAFRTAYATLKIKGHPFEDDAGFEALLQQVHTRPTAGCERVPVNVEMDQTVKADWVRGGHGRSLRTVSLLLSGCYKVGRSDTHNRELFFKTKVWPVVVQQFLTFIYDFRFLRDVRRALGTFDHDDCCSQ